jgi:NAD(P)-dependent dehydrogenase (short-subunit alcohol dehydrogenase family)
MVVAPYKGTIVSESDIAFMYKAAKAGLHHMTKVLAAQLSPRGITVNCIAPGLVFFFNIVKQECAISDIISQLYPRTLPLADIKVLH